MTGDFFTRLSQRLHEVEPAVRPVIPSRFAYGPVFNADGRGDFAEKGDEQESSIYEVTESDGYERGRTLTSPAHTDQHILPDPPPTGHKRNRSRIKRSSAGHGTAKLRGVANKQVPEPSIHEAEKHSSRDHQAVQTNAASSPLVSRKIKPDHDAAGRQPDGKNIWPHTVRRRRATVNKKPPDEAGRRIPVAYTLSEPNPFHDSKKQTNKGVAEARPTIRVSIGRIDVRAVTPPPASRRPAPKRPGPSLPLDAYLKQRNEGRR
jgi:hypothetical protein